MPKVSTGDNAPALVLPAIDGSTFDMQSVRGKKVILTFFRFSTCPLCNMRIRKIKQRWNEFSQDTVMVGVFDADIADLTKRMTKNTTSRSPSWPTNPMLRSNPTASGNRLSSSCGGCKSPLTLLQATLRGYVPLTMSIGKLSTIPVDMLIDENGRVVDAHYCKDTADPCRLTERSLSQTERL